MRDRGATGGGEILFWGLEMRNVASSCFLGDELGVC